MSDVQMFWSLCADCVEFLSHHVRGLSREHFIISFCIIESHPKCNPLCDSRILSATFSAFLRTIRSYSANDEIMTMLVTPVKRNILALAHNLTVVTAMKHHHQHSHEHREVPYALQRS